MSPEEQQSFINQLRSIAKCVPIGLIVDYIPIYNWTDSGLPFIIYYAPLIGDDKGKQEGGV